MTPKPSIASQAPLPRYGAGDVVGHKYLLEEPMGEGGMGTVWRARNLVLGAPVAVKLLQPELRSQEAEGRLLREARIAARLKHPGIVRVFDFEKTARGDFFIVMELLEGPTLASFLERRGKIAPAEAVRLLLPVVDALCAVHASGVVHRDLKPGNIVLAHVGQRVRPKLVDFGIAQWARPEADFKLTCAGTVLGSPSYMAPEQARGLEVDHRADIWGICLILYEAVSGRGAFEGQSYNAVLRAVVEDELVPFDEGSFAEAELWAIVARGLAKAPAQRFGSMHELGTVLAHWLLAHGGLDDQSTSEVARSWLRARAQAELIQQAKALHDQADRPGPLGENQPVASLAPGALTTTQVRGYRRARKPSGRGSALLGRALIAALLLLANASAGNREMQSQPAPSPVLQPVSGMRPNHPADIDASCPGIKCPRSLPSQANRIQPVPRRLRSVPGALQGSKQLD
jgi:serine/threonine protein kinase